MASNGDEITFNLFALHAKEDAAQAENLFKELQARGNCVVKNALTDGAPARQFRDAASACGAALVVVSRAFLASGDLRAKLQYLRFFLRKDAYFFFLENLDAPAWLERMRDVEDSAFVADGNVARAVVQLYESPFAERLGFAPRLYWNRSEAIEAAKNGCIYLSYADRNDPDVAELIDALNRVGARFFETPIDGWRAEEKNQALENADAMIVAMSQEYLNIPGRRQELQYWLAVKNKPALVLRLTRFVLPPYALRLTTDQTIIARSSFATKDAFYQAVLNHPLIRRVAIER